MLHKIQQTFKESILAENNDACQYLKVPETKGVSQEERLNIYRNNTFVSLKKALLDVYPTLAEVVGIEFFRYMTHEFITQHPPKDGALIFYGASLGAFLKEFKPVQNYPYLPALAELEWAIHTSYYAEDADALTPNNLAGFDEDTIAKFKFCFVPSCQLLQFDHAVYSLYQAIQNKQDVTAINLQQPEYVCIYRNELLDVEIKQLSSIQCLFYNALNGKTLIEATQELQGEENNNIQQWIAFAVENKLLTKKENKNGKL